ncbi:MAG: hypothetical protein ACFFBD_07225 [Candidatus Hodarchaeota archaeon]
MKERILEEKHFIALFDKRGSLKDVLCSNCILNGWMPDIVWGNRCYKNHCKHCMGTCLLPIPLSEIL